MRPDPRVADLTATPELFAILVRHAYRGVRVQFLLRAVLLAFMVAVIAFVPPAHDRGACYVLVASYAVWAVAIALWTRAGGVGPVRWMWLALLVDALALGSLTLVTGVAAEQSWTADILVNGLFLIPMLAATQLRALVCAAVATLTTVVYLIASLVTQNGNGEPLSSILLRTSVLAGLGAGCVALSRVQLSRVVDISALASDRAELLTDLIGVEGRERTRLAEQLHDGALQYILAARLDLEDVRDSGDLQALERVEYALNESATLLRSTVSDLHPAVLHAAGLIRALQDLLQREGDRSEIAMRLHAAGWPDVPSAVDELLYSTARELVTNVGKHAQATSVDVTLELAGESARLIVADNGRGMDESMLSDRLAGGHVGIASLRARVAGAGGSMTITAGQPSGTTVTVAVGLRPPA
jgi:two-component system, NarL family, sensor kinase